LGPSFREDGADDCLSLNCSFGGPPELTHGVEMWRSEALKLPWMIYHRMLTHPRRTYNVREADTFFVPAWGNGAGGTKVPCPNPAALWAELLGQNPLLKSDAEKVGPRYAD
jgi:hypothetical protein